MAEKQCSHSMTKIVLRKNQRNAHEKPAFLHENATYVVAKAFSLGHAADEMTLVRPLRFGVPRMLPWMNRSISCTER